MRMHQRLPAPPPWLRPPPKELLRERLGDGRLTEGRLLPKEPEGRLTAGRLEAGRLLPKDPAGWLEVGRFTVGRPGKGGGVPTLLPPCGGRGGR